MPRVSGRIRYAAQRHTRTALRTLAAVMNDEQAPAAARVTAATILLDRGWGKPARTCPEFLAPLKGDVPFETMVVRFLPGKNDENSAG